jgi:hypothetical protein
MLCQPAFTFSGMLNPLPQLTTTSRNFYCRFSFIDTYIKAFIRTFIQTDKQSVIHSGFFISRTTLCCRCIHGQCSCTNLVVSILHGHGLSCFCRHHVPDWLSRSFWLCLVLSQRPSSPLPSLVYSGWGQAYSILQLAINSVWAVDVPHSVF